MTFAEDVRTLLDDDLPDTAAERGLYGALSGTALLLEFMQELVEADDAESLRALCYGTVPLHDLTSRYCNVVGAPPAPHQAPFSGGDPVTGAVRNLAALGLALVDEAGLVTGHLDVARTWLAHTNAAPGAAAPAGWVLPACRHRRRLVTIVESLHGREFGTAMVVWLLELDQAGPRRRAEAAVEVLLDRGDTGIRATLRGAVLRGTPAALVPDPRSMVLFSADERFRSGLESAWRSAGGKGHGTVVWSLSDLDGPIDHVRDVSLTAAFAVLLDELRRIGSRLRGRFTVRRISAGTAVVGGVNDEGELVSVSGYLNKMAAAADLDRVVVPPGDLAKARTYATGRQSEVVAATTWQDAARHSRRRNRQAMLRIARMSLVVVLVGAMAGGGFWWRQRHVQEVRDTAAQVAQQAFDLSSGDDSGLALLLAMASDDIAARVGKRTENLDLIARGNASLRRILRPDEGRFDELAVSRNGSWAVLSTSTGAAQVVSTKSGDTFWRRKGSGVERPSPGVYVSSVAMSRAGQRAAVATTDLTITVLENKDRTWPEAATLKLPVPSRPGALNTELNKVDLLSFTPKGKALVAYTGRVGLFQFDTADLTAPPRKCPVPSGAVAMSVTDDTALLTTGRKVFTINLKNCAQSVVFTAPQDVELHDAVDDGGVVAAVTRGAQLLVMRPGKPETLLSDRGPYHGVSITVDDEQPHLSAATGSGTFGWLIRERTQEFGLRKSGRAVRAMGIVVRVHGGIAEIHDDRHAPATIAATPYFGGRSVEWAGSNLVLRGHNALWAGPQAATMSAEQFSDPASYRKLELPENIKTQELVTSGHGPWAALLFRVGATETKQLLVWNVVDGRRYDIVPPGTQAPNHVVFLDDDLYVGYLDGDVKRFRLRDGAWQHTDTRRLPARVVALGARDGTGGVYAVVNAAADKQPTVVRLSKTDLAVTAESPVGGPTSITQVRALSDGQVVVGTGAGLITFLTPQLQVRGTHQDGQLRFVLDITEVPGFRQIIISGVRRSVVLDQVTRAPRADAWAHGAPFESAAPSSDGRVLATYSTETSDLAMWTLDDPDLRARVCRAVGRDLTSEEWTTYVGSDLSYEPVCGS